MSKKIIEEKTVIKFDEWFKARFAEDKRKYKKSYYFEDLKAAYEAGSSGENEKTMNNFDVGFDSGREAMKIDLLAKIEKVNTFANRQKGIYIKEADWEAIKEME